MTPLTAKLLHLTCMVIWWLIRRPFVRKARRNTLVRNGRDAREWALMTMSTIGLGVIPFAYIATDFPAGADQTFSPLRAWLGIGVFAGSLTLFQATHRTLGRNWSVTLAVRDGHELITRGVYRWLRHPMYAAFWLWALAQALLLQNWVAGLAGLIGFGALYALRIGREEALMRLTFGAAARTRRVIPFLH